MANSKISTSEQVVLISKLKNALFDYYDALKQLKTNQALYFKYYKKELHDLNKLNAEIIHHTYYVDYFNHHSFEGDFNISKCEDYAKRKSDKQIKELNKQMNYLEDYAKNYKSPENCNLKKLSANFHDAIDKYSPDLNDVSNKNFFDGVVYSFINNDENSLNYLLNQNVKSSPKELINIEGMITQIKKNTQTIKDNPDYKISLDANSKESIKKEREELKKRYDNYLNDYQNLFDEYDEIRSLAIN